MSTAEEKKNSFVTSLGCYLISKHLKKGMMTMWKYLKLKRSIPKIIKGIKSVWNVLERVGIEVLR